MPGYCVHVTFVKFSTEFFEPSFSKPFVLRYVILDTCSFYISIDWSKKKGTNKEIYSKQLNKNYNNKHSKIETETTEQRDPNLNHYFVESKEIDDDFLGARHHHGIVSILF